MKKLKPNFALFITLFLLIIGGLFVRAAIFTYDKCFESEKSKIEEYFACISDTAAKRAGIAYEKMLFEAESTARYISEREIGAAELEAIFEHRYSVSGAQAGLFLSAGDSFEYGGAEYRESFGQTAEKAAQSGMTQVSEPILCSDGEQRFAVAAPAEGGGAALLVFPVSVLTEMIDSDILEGQGRILITDGGGSPASGYGGAEYEAATAAAIGSDEGLFTYAAPNGEKLYISTSPLGMNGWMIACYVTDDYVRSGVSSVFSVIFGADIVSFALVAAFTLVSVLMISARHKKLHMARKRFDIVTKQSARATYQYDRKNNRISIISGSERIGLPDGLELMSIDMFLELVHPADRREFDCAIEDFDENGTTSVSVRVSKLGGSDEYRWYNIDATRLTQIRHGAELVIGSIEDIDERERERLMLRQKATTDPLTGLYDRAETQRIINERLSNLGENDHSTFCIIDLDNFKLINDLYGHECGDRALLFFSEKLKSTFRFGDIIGRLGGDEFMVYIALTADRKVVERRFAELMESLSKASPAPELPEISCSVGYVTARKGDTFESVYKRADEAMYKAKTAGKRRAVGE